MVMSLLVYLLKLLELMMKSKKKIFISADGGGFNGQTTVLLPKLREKYNVIFYLPVGSNLRFSLLPTEKLFYVPKFQNVDKIMLKGFVIACIKGCFYISKYRPTAILAVGSATILPFSIICKFLPIKIIFVESLTRVKSLSKVGKFLYEYKLASKFYVQWEELLPLYPGTIYRGRCI